jgi:spore coat polysaccharide biosynthesis protein SpsF
MNKKYKTQQEEFWAGEFGSEYISRNQSEQLLASNINFFCKALRVCKKINNCVEFGANIGMNLKAIKMLYPKLEMQGIEINANAASKLSEIIGVNNIFNGSIFDFEVKKKFDLVLIKGVLIHINPNKLNKVYEKLVESTNRYLLVAEYYSPSPVSISYRGHQDRLFKRDFAGEIMNRHTSIKLIDYGFVYRLDPVFPQDDISWFLMEKKL